MVYPSTVSVAGNLRRDACKVGPCMWSVGTFLNWICAEAWKYKNVFRLMRKSQKKEVMLSRIKNVGQRPTTYPKFHFFMAHKGPTRRNLMFQKSSKRVAITLVLIMIVTLLLAACSPVEQCKSQGGTGTVTLSDGSVIQCSTLLKAVDLAKEFEATPTTAPATTAVVTATVTTANPTAQPAPTGPLGMKYQYDAGCAQTSTPMEYPACILQRVQAGELTGEQAVVMIQQLGAKYEAPSFEGMTLTLPNRQAAVVWCPSGASFYPPDTARPLEGTTGNQWAQNLFVVDAATGGPDREIKAKDNPCWMAYVK